jgi:hypothetical protein
MAAETANPEYRRTPLKTSKEYPRDLIDKSDKGHIYCFHQNGEIYCSTNVSIKNSAEGNVGGIFCDDDRLTLMSAVYILVAWLHADVILDKFKIAAFS